MPIPSGPQQRKQQRRTGNTSLAYLGVLPESPTNYVTFDRDPISGTTSDYKNWYIGDEWENRTNNNVWKLVNKDGGIATWLLLVPGTGNMTNLKDQAGNVVYPNANGSITIDGGEMLNTDAPFPSVIRVNLDRGLDGQIPIAATGLSTEWANITAGANVVVTDGPNSVTISAAGGGAGDLTAAGNDGSTATSVAGTMNILGAHGINTSGDLADTFTVAIDNTITLGDLADVTGADALTLTTGDVTLSSGNINLTHTDATGVTGVITNNGNRFIHNHSIHNTFVGDEAGNFTMDPILCQQNVGIGQRALFSLTTGKNNCAVGVATLGSCTTGENNSFIGPGIAPNVTTGSNNCGIGFDNFSSLTTGSFNIGIGTNVGDAYIGAESDNILINNTGVIGESGTIRIGVTGAGEQTRCFIAAIRGVTTDNADAISVLIDSDGQLGTISSSIRFKENVEDMNTCSEKIYDLRPVTFNYKSDESKKKQYGLIAEEVADTFPYLAVKDDKGNVETVKYHELNTLLLNELIKLRGRVEELEAKLTV